MLKQTLLLLHCFLTVSYAFGHNRDTTYRYFICVHQKAKPGKAYFSSLMSINQQVTPSIYIELWDEEKNKVEPSIITLSSAKNDSVLKTVRLDSGNVYLFDKLLPGEYNIKVQSMEYKSMVVKNISLSSTKSKKIYFEIGLSDMFTQIDIVCKRNYLPGS